MLTQRLWLVPNETIIIASAEHVSSSVTTFCRDSIFLSRVAVYTFFFFFFSPTFSIGWGCWRVPRPLSDWVNVSLRFARAVPFDCPWPLCCLVCVCIVCVHVRVRVCVCVCVCVCVAPEQYPCQSWGSRGEYLKRNKPAAAVDDDVGVPRLLPSWTGEDSGRRSCVS